ncbi:uncharacterized protein IWZ02DRAFT_296895 [Phyllosticta citriasiana]|uniref:uncharacterized protein n=1 Tax=Phyllosticta citriasiana TaxID=595635 RepID=UPI0030FD59C5
MQFQIKTKASDKLKPPHRSGGKSILGKHRRAYGCLAWIGWASPNATETSLRFGSRVKLIVVRQMGQEKRIGNVGSRGDRCRMMCWVFDAPPFSLGLNADCGCVSACTLDLVVVVVGVASKPIYRRRKRKKLEKGKTRHMCSNPRPSPNSIHQTDCKQTVWRLLSKHVCFSRGDYEGEREREREMRNGSRRVGKYKNVRAAKV